MIDKIEMERNNKKENKNIISVRTQRILMNHFNRAIKTPSEFCKFALDPENINIWYILLSGLAGENDEFKDGQYIIKLIANDNYPHNPPAFYFMTPNGVFEIDVSICISIGLYHSENYRQALGMHGFANQVVSSIIGWKDLERGIGIQKNIKPEIIKNYTFSSVSYNKNVLKYYLDLIENNYNEYSKKWVK